MSDPDRLLAQLWAADEPPQRDPAFVLAVMARVERRRFVTGVLALAVTALAAGLVIWVLAPLARPALQALQPALGARVLEPLAAALAMAAFLWNWANEGQVLHRR